jgi:hypothetical protein
VEGTLYAEAVKRHLAWAWAIAEYFHIDDFIVDPTKDFNANNLNFLNNGDNEEAKGGEGEEDFPMASGAGPNAMSEAPPAATRDVSLTTPEASPAGVPQPALELFNFAV